MTLFEHFQAVAACPHTKRCRRQRPDMALPRPSPDYVGPSYRGLVIIGANPGIGHTTSQSANDSKMFALQERIAHGDQVAFDELISFLPDSMRGWRQVVSEKHQSKLNYDIRDIAYVNIVKCGTRNQGSNPVANFSGTNIAETCWTTHTKPLLDLLQPTHIVALWSGVIQALDALGYDHGGAVCGHYDGARHKPDEIRLAGPKAVIDDFYGRT